MVGNGDKTDVIRVRVTPNDGTVDGTAVTSDPVTIINTAPVATTPSFSPSPPTTKALLTGSTTITDADFDTVKVATFTWSAVGGAIV